MSKGTKVTWLLTDVTRQTTYTGTTITEPDNSGMVLVALDNSDTPHKKVVWIDQADLAQV